MATVRPVDVAQLRDAIADAVRAGVALEIRGGGTKSAFGAPRDAAILDMGGFTGIVDYDPAELVLTVRPGTSLASVQELVATERQMLAFEPWDHGPLFGRPVGATIGGVVAAGVAGPRRVTAGGVRDHLLGFEAVSGRAEHFAGGAKVVKNVTGYDLPKLLAGSWGRLAAMTQLTLKVLPCPRMTVTLAADGLDRHAAHAAMTRALGSHAEVSAAAHIPADAVRSITLFRIAGFEPSVQARAKLLPDLLRDHAKLRVLPDAEAMRLWHAVGHAEPLGDGTLWRLHVPPSKACGVIDALEPLGARWLLDWGGGLVWLQCEGDAALIRQAATTAGGDATLVRAGAEMRAQVPAQHPRAPGVMALEARVRRAFDPAGVFETGRFLDAD